MLLPGKPSDEVADVLATGSGDIATTFVSMATRHPDGTDADYLQWHTLDHRPEQHRLSAVRASLRLVSTPACRAARAVRHERFDPVDHVMTYFFTDTAGMDGFLTLSTALGGAGRKLPLLPPVERGVYEVQSRVAAARIKVGAHVLPWWPARGVYLLLETHGALPTELLESRGRCRNLVDGVTRRRYGTCERTSRAAAHLLLSRRRSGCHRRTTTPSARTALGNNGNRSALRRALSPGRPSRVEPLCAVTAGAYADGVDGRLRQRALADLRAVGRSPTVNGQDGAGRTRARGVVQRGFGNVFGGSIPRKWPICTHFGARLLDDFVDGLSAEPAE